MKNTIKNNEIKILWKPFKGMLSKKALSIKGVLFDIFDIDPKSDDLAFTMNGNAIYLNNGHEMAKKLDKSHYFAFYEGIFAHELLHQLCTDFKSDMKFRSYDADNADFIHTLFNIMEDPAIEHFAHCFFGGRILHSLYYAVNYIYKESPEIDPSASDLTQYLNALIHFGDGGIVKGKLSDTAQEYFDKSIGIVWECINEPNSTKRADKAIEVFEIIKPLVEQNKEDMNDFKNQMKQSGKANETTSRSGGRGFYNFNEEDYENTENADDNDWQSQKSQSQKQTAEQSQKSNGGSMGEETENDENNNGLQSAQNDENASDNDTKSSQNSQSSDNSQNKENKKKSQKPKKSSQKSQNTDKGTSGSDFELSDSDMESLEKELQNSADKEESENNRTDKANNAKELEIPKVKELGSLSGVFAKVKAQNKFADALKDESVYESYLQEVAPAANALTKGLKRILQKKQDEITYADKGKVSVKRLQTIAGNRMTTRVFSKRKDAANKFDAAIMVVFDVSGSMTGTNESQAKKSAIALCETCNNLHIPVKVMTFSGDNYGYDANHTHYVNWENTKADRQKLTSIKSDGLTFMSYAVYSAGKMLAARPETNKIMIVITDGQPYDHYHEKTEDSVRYTQLAVKEVKKFASIIAMGIGASEETLLNIFKNDFVQSTDINQMFNMLSNKLKSEVKKW